MDDHLCKICKTPFDDAEHLNCGGDCLTCMAEIANDTDCIEELANLRTRKDAARWQEFATRASDTKTSAWHRLLNELRLEDPDECFDIEKIIDAAIAERAAKGKGNG